MDLWRKFLYEIQITLFWSWSSVHPHLVESIPKVHRTSSQPPLITQTNTCPHPAWRNLDFWICGEKSIFWSENNLGFKQRTCHRCLSEDICHCHPGWKTIWISSKDVVIIVWAKTSIIVNQAEIPAPILSGAFWILNFGWGSISYVREYLLDGRMLQNIGKQKLSTSVS